MKNIFTYNFLSRVIFLLITPVFFQFFAFGFIWHSIYWGVITTVMLIWLGFIVISPLFGRIGCGWFCFMGTIIDMTGKHSIYKTKWKKPRIWVRLLILLPFFATSITFYFLNSQRGITHNFNLIPGFLKLDFSMHYKIVWIADIASAIFLGLLLDKRWACKNLCMMGTLCAAGATYSRLIPVVDTNKCTQCHICEKECLTGIQIIEYVKFNKGLISNSECILCGKCVDVCKLDAIKLKFIWDRKNYKNSIKSAVTNN
ncbi:MAG: 4Fe-4S binding protein [Bacteroidales bacterium]